MPKKLLKSTALVSSMTLLSRVFGFMRDVILARAFGAGYAFDAFVVAFKLPNFFRRVFGEGAFTQAFLPILAQKRNVQTQEEMKLFLGRVLGTLLIVVTLVVVVFELFAPGVIMIFAPGLLKSPDRFHLATDLLRLLFPYLILITAAAFMTGVLNTFYQFGIPALSPVLLNVAFIAAATLVAPHLKRPIFALAYAVSVGGIMQCMLQVVPMMRLGLRIRPVWGWKYSDVQGVMKRMVPALFGVSIAQVSLLVDTLFASFLVVGSISWLYYSERLIGFPLGVIGVALSTVVMPHLSEQHAASDAKGFGCILDWAVRSALLVGPAAAVGLVVLAGPLIATLIYHGAFTPSDVANTQKSLIAYSLGLPAFMLIKVLASAFYSRQDIKTPVKVASLALLVNIILNFALIYTLKHAGLALASSLAAYVNAGLLLHRLHKQGSYQSEHRSHRFYFQLVLGNLAMYFLLHYAAPPITEWVSWGLWARVWHLGYLVSAGVAVYVVALYLVGMRWKDIKAPV